jgi:hypothetical protein
MSLFGSKASKGVRLPKLTTPELRTLKSFFAPVFWGTRDDPQVLQHMKAASELVDRGHHFADNFFTWCRNNSMLDDEVFVKSWEANAETPADKAIIWRRYILSCAGYHCLQLEGDFVECGAYAGVGVKTVIDYLGAAQFPRNFWLYDLFEHEDGMLHHPLEQHGPDLEGRVRDKFNEYPQVKIFKGNIPEVFEGQSPKQIAYLHIDLNQAPAEVASLEALFDRIVPGGIVILDDYEWAGVYRPQKIAEDAWFEARQYRVFPLPTGQGFVIKR